MKSILAMLLFVCPLAAQQWYASGAGVQRFAEIDAVRPNISQQFERPTHQTLYVSSVASLVGANALDLASSWGRPELNPFLTPGSNGGRFGWQSATIKLGLTATTLLFQRHVLRRRPELRRPFAVSNFIAAGAMSGIAARNYAIGAPRIR